MKKSKSKIQELEEALLNANCGIVAVPKDFDIIPLGGGIFFVDVHHRKEIKKMVNKLSFRPQEAQWYKLDKHMECVRKHINDMCDILGKEHPSTDYLYELKCMIMAQSDEFKVGDEVYVSGTKQNAIITSLNPYGNGKLANIIFSDGNTACRDTSVFCKTGRHFQQIEDILKEMEVE